jgi:hypothetical protein
MSHAAIVCREYGLPAVTGTAFATRPSRPAADPRRRVQRHRHDPRVLKATLRGADEAPQAGCSGPASSRSRRERDADRAELTDPGRARDAHGRAAAPLLVPDRVRARTRRVVRSRRSGCSARTGAVADPERRVRDHRERARTGAPRWCTASSTRTASAAATTAGSSTSTATASSSPPRPTTRTSATASSIRPARPRRWAGWSGSTSARPGPRAPALRRVRRWTAFKRRRHTTLPCNWLQIMENSVDPHHVEWLHGYYFKFLGETKGFEAPKAFQKKHMKTGFDEMEWGILKRRCSRAAPRRTTTGRSGTRWCSRTSCASAAPASTRCRSASRSTTPTRGSCSTRTTTRGRTVGPEQSARRRATSTCGRTRRVGTSSTTSRARTSWPG